MGVGHGMAGERRRTEDGEGRLTRRGPDWPGLFHFCSGLVRRRARTRTQRRKELARQTGLGTVLAVVVESVLVLAQHGKEERESEAPACEGRTPKEPRLCSWHGMRCR
jgi:hypothetical protein